MRTILKLAVFLWAVGLSMAQTFGENAKWKQVSGEDQATHDYFVANESAQVIWGYADGLWKVACKETCHEVLARYLPLERMEAGVGYWVKFDGLPPSPDEQSEGLFGNWAITRKSVDHWDNVTAALFISKEGSHDLTGHPFALLPLGLKEHEPISKFDLQNVEVIEEGVLQLDLILYSEEPKTEEQLWNELPPELHAEIEENILLEKQKQDEKVEKYGRHWRVKHDEQIRREVTEKMKWEFHKRGYRVTVPNNETKAHRCFREAYVQNYAGPLRGGLRGPYYPNEYVTGKRWIAAGAGFDLEVHKVSWNLKPETPKGFATSTEMRSPHNYLCNEDPEFYNQVPRFKRKYLPITSFSKDRFVVEPEKGILFIFKKS